ncbi:acyl-CoA synthetase [Nocardia aurantia]|uniref:Long-chain-fatty-acid--CoA ligase FadD13 n=1 Tax=Nocardia aurantia TaxID=2585199 RepID=A0A7K0DG80_9NOCA|nr:long-chain fatty acid--CoA ligase [Nocardia aurantia]MQY24815.1 Long-chain-fatty-acid--CoA ligase FadD13 [Nocardia aurantia]
MRDQGMGSWPGRRARMTPHRVALVQDGTETTYLALHRGATRLAHGLRRRGIGRGDRVAYLGSNSVAFVETVFAIAMLGAVAVPVNTRLAPAETAWILADCGARLLIHDRGSESIAGAAEIRELGVDTVAVEPETAEVTLETLRDNGSDEPIDENIALDDLFMIQYTSGTTGRPKGVLLTHGNITWNVYNLLVDIDVRNTEVALVTAPLFHTAALNQVLFPVLLKGGTALIEARWDPDRALRLIETHGVTMLFGVTSMYLGLSRAAGFATADLRTLRTALSGGAPIPMSLLETYRDRGLNIIQGYGLTEASPGVTMLRATDPGSGTGKLGSAGTPCFFTDVALAPTDSPGTVGEVLVHGPNVSPGYWNRPDAAHPGGWLHTGDVGRRDEDGYLYIVDRLKDMYISGGENVYPAEVEQALYAHEAVAECAVIGIPDPVWGEVGRAVVTPKPGAAPTESDLLTFLAARIARYKIPKSVVFSAELPHNASGKLAKARIRAEYGGTTEGHR